VTAGCGSVAPPPGLGDGGRCTRGGAALAPGYFLSPLRGWVAWLLSARGGSAQLGGTCIRPWGWVACLLSARGGSAWAASRSSADKYGYNSRMRSRVMPSESMRWIVPTVTRVPRMHGLPPMMAGLVVMRGFMMFNRILETFPNRSRTKGPRACARGKRRRLLREQPRMSRFNKATIRSWNIQESTGVEKPQVASYLSDVLELLTE